MDARSLKEVVALNDREVIKCRVEQFSWIFRFLTYSMIWRAVNFAQRWIVGVWICAPNVVAIGFVGAKRGLK